LDEDEAADASRAVTLFLVLLLALSGFFYAFPLFVPDAAKRWLAYSAAFMWCPGLAALLTQLALRRNVRGLGWSLGRCKYYALAYGLPLAFCLPVYSLVWGLGLGAFDGEALEAAKSRIGLPPGLLGSIGLLGVAAVLAPTGIIATLGEELGWRGLLVPRLAALTSPTRASVITGLIWSLWHYPVHSFVLPAYLPGLPIWYATACFTVSVVAISFVYTWLRLRSGSVWPAAMLHATSNAFQGSFEKLTTHSDITSYFTYEFGLGFAIVIPVIALPFWKGLRREKGSPSAAHATPLRPREAASLPTREK
jgi:membrane protease YdiL (CAAX protease family)